MASGSEIITIGRWKPTKVMLNASPYRRRPDSMKETGRSSQRSVWIAGGSVGPGGSEVMTAAYAYGPRRRAAPSGRAGGRLFGGREGLAAQSHAVERVLAERRVLRRGRGGGGRGLGALARVLLHLLVH